MSFSYTTSASESFTLTNAKRLCSKVTADMERCQQSYGRPTNDQINNYGTELAYLLRDGYVDEYEFGFQRADGERLVSWHYRVINGALSGTDDRPGKILNGLDMNSAVFFNYLTRSSKWIRLSDEERKRINESLPFQRISGDGPKGNLGYFVEDRTYSSGGVALTRRTFHSNQS